MTEDIRKAIEYLTSTTERLYEKPYLKQAITSHLKVSFHIDRTDAERAVEEYFSEQA